MQQHRPILIVGAGPTGLTAAMELSRWGLPVRIIDKAPEPSITSRALAVQARTLELLSQRGLTDEMLHLGNRVAAVNFHSEDKLLWTVDLHSIPSRFNYVLLLAQNQTERLLAEQCNRQGVDIERATDLIAFSQPQAVFPVHSEVHSDDYVKAVLRHADGQVEELEAAYLISAEGSHSLIRNTLNLEFKGKSLEQAYALADLHIDGEIPEHALSMFVTERGLLAMFPLGNRRFRMIVTDPEPNTIDPDLAEMQKFYNAQARIPAVLRDPIWTSRFRINSRMIGTFSARRIFFGGDSAHIHSPAGGQGMNTGIQDMINLSWKLALVYQGRASHRLLDTYTEERVPIIRTLLSTTERATDTVNQTSSIMRQLITHVLPFLLDFDTVQEHGARMLSQVNLNYRSSTLSENKSSKGQLRAGDRVPDIMVASSATASTAVPLYSLLDPSCFTLLSTENTPAELPATAFPSFVKFVHVRAAEETHNHQAFIESFGKEGGLFAVRPDAYLGFVSQVEDHTELLQWFNDHFGTSSTSQTAAQGA